MPLFRPELETCPVCESNPFDKQQFSENDCFRSNDFEQMTARLNFLKETRGIGVFTARPGMGKSYALRCRVFL